jgi:hypothetical protein
MLPVQASRQRGHTRAAMYHRAAAAAMTARAQRRRERDKMRTTRFPFDIRRVVPDHVPPLWWAHGAAT